MADRPQLRNPDIVNPARGGWGPYDAQEIFREMVLGEIRSGRVSRVHHARIISFAAEIGLSSSTAAEIIAECCREASASDDPETIRNAQRLASPRIGKALRAGITIAAIAAAELLLIWLL